MVERNEIKADSFESKLYDTIIGLGDEVASEGDLFDLSNQQIREKLIEMVEAEESLENPGLYYSAVVGSFTQTRITQAAKSRFKAKPIPMRVDGKPARGLRFSQKNLNRVKTNYDVPKTIELKETVGEETYLYTLFTLSTLSGRISTSKKGENHAQNDAQNG